MRLIDWIGRDDIRTLEGLASVESVLEVAFPEGDPRRRWLSRLLLEPPGAITGGRVFFPHLSVPNLTRPELVMVLPIPQPISGPPVRLWVVGLFPENRPELQLQVLSLVTAFCLALPPVGSADDLYRQIVSSGESGKRVFANLPIEQVMTELRVSGEGLTSEEARGRLQGHGANLLKTARTTPALVRLLRNFVSVFALLLWGAGALCFLPGVQMPALGWAIFTVVITNGVFSFWQEAKAERAVEALQRLLPSLATVTRAGVLVRIPAAELVPGDILWLEEGDRVPADLRLIEADELRVDNSSLTGESRPLYKTPEVLETTLYFLWTEIPNLVFAGTTVATGRGKGVVMGTGMETEIGKIAQLTQAVHREPSPLQREMKRAVNVLTLVSLGIGALFFVLGQLWGGMTFVGAFLFTIGITVANIPEGLLPTLSLSLAMGVQRMARRRVLVKNLASVETLGGTTVLCTDKTGTLTTNRVSVRDLWLGGTPTTVDAPEGPTFASGEGKLFLLTAILCNNSHFTPEGTSGDPTEVALLDWARTTGADVAAALVANPRLGHLPFESVRKCMSTLHQTPEGLRVFTKGAPLELLEKCTHRLAGGQIEALDEEQRRQIAFLLDGWAQQGRRTLGMATRTWSEGQTFTKENAERDLVFLGATGMIDPPRPEVPEAVALCRRAGIRLVMITGDYGPTARAIADEVGMSDAAHPARVVTGRDLDALGTQGLRETLLVPGPLIFARMEPAHKMQVVAAFKDLGEVVAVTGDGINDAAALKRADIGIAMGADVNAVVKEAAVMVVLDGNFASIVAAIQEGRAVYANIRRFVTYVFASNVPELVPFLLSVLVGLPLPLTVLQILVVDLGTDLLPALGLGTERPEPDLMDRPPRARKERLIDLSVFVRGYLFLGVIETLLSLGAYFWAYHLRGWQFGMPLVSSGPVYQAATTMALAGIVACQVGNVLACRTTRTSLFHVGLGSNRLVLWGVLSELVLMLVLIEVPFFQALLGTVSLTLADVCILPLFPLVLLAAEELRKALVRHRTKPVRPA